MIILKGGILVNSVMLVGRLTKDLEVKKLESGKEVTNLLLAVSRGYRNAEGNYETDFIIEFSRICGVNNLCESS